MARHGGYHNVDIFVKCRYFSLLSKMADRRAFRDLDL